LNPVLYARSQRLVRWTRNSPGNIAPHWIVEQARLRYPALSNSNAVEAVLLDLLEGQAEPELAREDSETLKRFAALSPSEKIEATLKRRRAFQYLKNLPWRNEKT
jgi:hypothetical protein